jgi:hypothetical protein
MLDFSFPGPASLSLLSPSVRLSVCPCESGVGRGGGDERTLVISISAMRTPSDRPPDGTLYSTPLRSASDAGVGFV